MRQVLCGRSAVEKRRRKENAPFVVVVGDEVDLIFLCSRFCQRPFAAESRMLQTACVLCVVLVVGCYINSLRGTRGAFSLSVVVVVVLMSIYCDLSVFSLEGGRRRR